MNTLEKLILNLKIVPGVGGSHGLNGTLKGSQFSVMIVVVEKRNVSHDLTRWDPRQ